MSAGVVAVVIGTVGPYHAARMSALARRSGQAGCLAIEVAGSMQEYGWRSVESEKFRRHTIYPDADYSRLSGRALRSGMTRVLNEVRPGVVAVNGWGFPEARAAIRWCNARGVPSVIMSDSQRRDKWRFPPTELLKRRLLAMTDAALVAGVRHAAYLETLGFDRERIRMGYDVVDNEHFQTGAEETRRDAVRNRQRLGLPERYFLTCARLVPKKGLHVLIEAYARYRAQAENTAWDLVVVGDGPLRSRLQREVSRRGLGARIHLAGFKQYDELPAYYGLAGAFVLPSLVDQWGLVVNEAMAAGLPVIVTEACGSAAELVRSGENGRVVAPRDAAELAAAMAELAGAPGLLSERGALSQHIVRDWTPDRFAREIVAAAAIAREHRISRERGTVLSQARRDIRVTLVTNMVPPYRVPMLRALSRRLGGRFAVVTMSRMERNRLWAAVVNPEFRLETVRGVEWHVRSRDWVVHLNWGVNARLRAQRPDVVIIGGWDTPSSWSALLAAKRLGAKVVLWSGSHQFSARTRRGPVMWLKRAFVRRCDAFLAYGTLAGEYLESLGAPRERLVVGANAVEVDRFESGTEHRAHVRTLYGVRDEVVVLSSGQLIERKGVDLVLKVMPALPRNTVLWIVGGGPLRAKYEALASAYCPERIHFLGPKSYDEMPDVYAAADVFVMTSRREVWGLVLNEAMAAGLPVVASTTAGATHDLVEEGITGLRFDPEDGESLRKALDRLILSPQERLEMGRRGQERVEGCGVERYAADMTRAAELAYESRDHRR